MIFDDVINLPKKQLLKLQKWFNSSRKKSYTCVVMAQNYSDLPIQMQITLSKKKILELILILI